MCAKSIELQLQVNEPLGLLYKIPDASVAVSPTARTEIHSSLNTLGLMDFLKPTKQLSETIQLSAPCSQSG